MGSCCSYNMPDKRLCNKSGPEKDAILNARKSTMKLLLIMSLIQTVLGFIAIVVGVVYTVYGSGNKKFPFNNGFAIWTVTSSVIAGCLGLAASRYDVDYEDRAPKGLSGLWFGKWINDIQASSMAGLFFGWSISSLVTVVKEKDKSDSTFKNTDTLLPLTIVMVVVGVILFFVAIHENFTHYRRRVLFVMVSNQQYQRFSQNQGNEKALDSKGCSMY